MQTGSLELLTKVPEEKDLYILTEFFKMLGPPPPPGFQNEKEDLLFTATGRTLCENSQGTYTGQNIGANRIDRVKTGAKHTVLISEIISVCILTVVFIFARPIVSAFGLGPEAIGYCTAHVRFVALCLPLFASYFPLLGLFQGADNALFSTFAATGALTIRVASCLSFPGDSGRRLSYDLVEHNFWLGSWFYDFMDTFSAREVAA